MLGAYVQIHTQCEVSIFNPVTADADNAAGR